MDSMIGSMTTNSLDNTLGFSSNLNFGSGALAENGASGMLAFDGSAINMILEGFAAGLELVAIPSTFAVNMNETSCNALVQRLITLTGYNLVATKETITRWPCIKWIPGGLTLPPLMQVNDEDVAGNVELNLPVLTQQGADIDGPGGVIKKGSAKAAARKNPPRPMNCWMIFRDEKYKELKHDNPNLTVQTISKMCSEMWKGMDKIERAFYMDRANTAKRLHQKLFPDYKYSPRKPGEKKKRQSRKTTAQAADSVATSDNHAMEDINQDIFDFAAFTDDVATPGVAVNDESLANSTNNLTAATTGGDGLNAAYNGTDDFNTATAGGYGLTAADIDTDGFHAMSTGGNGLTAANTDNDGFTDASIDGCNFNTAYDGTNADGTTIQGMQYGESSTQNVQDSVGIDHIQQSEASRQSALESEFGSSFDVQAGVEEELVIHTGADEGATLPNLSLHFL